MTNPMQTQQFVESANNAIIAVARIVDNEMLKSALAAYDMAMQMVKNADDTTDGHQKAVLQHAATVAYDTVIAVAHSIDHGNLRETLHVREEIMQLAEKYNMIEAAIVNSGRIVSFHSVEKNASNYETTMTEYSLQQIESRSVLIFATERIRDSIQTGVTLVNGSRDRLFWVVIGIALLAWSVINNQSEWSIWELVIIVAVVLIPTCAQLWIANTISNELWVTGDILRLSMPIVDQVLVRRVKGRQLFSRVRERYYDSDIDFDTGYILSDLVEKELVSLHNELLKGYNKGVLNWIFGAYLYKSTTRYQELMQEKRLSIWSIIYSIDYIVDELESMRSDYPITKDYNTEHLGIRESRNALIEIARTINNEKMNTHIFVYDAVNDLEIQTLRTELYARNIVIGIAQNNGYQEFMTTTFASDISKFVDNEERLHRFIMDNLAGVDDHLLQLAISAYNTAHIVSSTVTSMVRNIHESMVQAIVSIGENKYNLLNLAYKSYQDVRIAVDVTLNVTQVSDENARNNQVVDTAKVAVAAANEMAIAMLKKAYYDVYRYQSTWSRAWFRGSYGPDHRRIDTLDIDDYRRKANTAIAAYHATRISCDAVHKLVNE